MPRIELPDGHLSYATCGTGPPLLAVLPAAAARSESPPALDALARHFTVITHDARGSGDSSPAPGEISVAGQTADAVALLDGLGIRSTAVLAHSTGCGVGVSLAAHHGERVSRLALVSPWTHGDPFLTAMQRLRQCAVRTLDAQQYARFNAAILFPPAFRREHQAGFDRLAAQAQANDAEAEAFTRRLDAILAFDARPLLAGIHCPTRVIAARDDQLMPPWFAEAMVDGIEGAVGVVLDDGGHMLLETRREAILEVLEPFFTTGLDR